MRPFNTGSKFEARLKCNHAGAAVATEANAEQIDL